MHDDFGKMPKQGFDLWSTIATQLARLFRECDKDSKICRKRWSHVYADYKKDKAHNSISGTDHKVTCQWFDIIDEYLHNQKNMVSYTHASAVGWEHQWLDWGSRRRRGYTILYQNRSAKQKCKENVGERESFKP